MNIITILLLQVVPCVPNPQCIGVQPIMTDEMAPCAGLLWSEEASRKALKCSKVDLPKCIADGKLSLKKCEALKSEYEIRAISAESLLQSVPEPDPEWMRPALTITAFDAGAIVGGNLIHTLD